MMTAADHEYFRMRANDLKNLTLEIVARAALCIEKDATLEMVDHFEREMNFRASQLAAIPTVEDPELVIRLSLERLGKAKQVPMEVLHFPVNNAG